MTNQKTVFPIGDFSQPKQANELILTITKAFSLNSTMKAIQIKDPQLIQEKVVVLRCGFNYTHIPHRQLYFPAACLFYDPEIDVEIAVKLNTLVVFFRINISGLDSLLKCSKMLRHHTALHHAAGFFEDLKI